MRSAKCSMHLYGFNGLERVPVEEAGAGDIVVFSGIDDLQISDTVCDRGEADALPALKVDEPTISMTFQVNKSPFAGQEGKFLTSRQIQGRLEQELVYMAQRADVEEELDRLDAHVGEVRRTLKKGGPCGRRLDFLMQELNREANTLSSKSMSSTTTQNAVELKVLIEQMREQIQNIE